MLNWLNPKWKMILKSCVELQELNESVKALLSAEDAEKEQMNGGNPK